VSWLITGYFVICIIGAMDILTNPQKYAATATATATTAPANKRVRFTDSS
jgi:hypothetical protein